MIFKDEYKKTNDKIILDECSMVNIVNLMKIEQQEQKSYTTTIYHKKKNIKAYITVAVVMVMVLSSISIFAANVWGQDFKEYFNWISKNYDYYNEYTDLESENFLTIEQISKLGQDVVASTECNNFNISVKKIINDNAGLYSIIEITTSNDINLSLFIDEDYTEDTLVITPILISDNILGYATSSSDSMIEKVSTDDTGETVWMLYLRYSYVLKNEQNSLTNLSILFNGLGAVTDSEEDLLLEIPVSNDVTHDVYSKVSDKSYIVFATKTYLTENADDVDTSKYEIIIEDVKLTPFSISYRQSDEYIACCKIVFNDGTYLYFDELDRLSVKDKTNGTFMISYLFPKPINLENIDDVIIGGTSIDFD